MAIRATPMRVDITVEPSAPVPEFLVKRASSAVLDAQTDGIRQLALRINSSRHVE